MTCGPVWPPEASPHAGAWGGAGGQPAAGVAPECGIFWSVFVALALGSAHISPGTALPEWAGLKPLRT